MVLRCQCVPAVPLTILTHAFCCQDSSSLIVTLCDLDAAVGIGEVRTRELKCSTAYCPPEHMKAHLADECLRALPSFDVWSLGVMLFELLAGRHLFAQDISDDNMVDSNDLNKLCLWLVAPDDLLDEILPDYRVAAGGDTDLHAMRAAACRLVRWCLQADASLRPSLEEILAQPLLSEAPTISRLSVASPKALLSDALVDMSTTRMRFHMFISHVQSEASGDVGTLYFFASQLGVHCWRDMNTSELTESAMRQGVYDSDVFVLFLTNSALSRMYCLKEISWALEVYSYSYTCACACTYACTYMHAYTHTVHSFSALVLHTCIVYVCVYMHACVCACV